MFSTINIPYAHRKSDLNLNAHEEAIIHVEEDLGIDVDNVEDIFQFIISATVGDTGGTTSLSAATLVVNDGQDSSNSDGVTRTSSLLSCE